MKDYAQYTSRIPSPLKRSPGKNIAVTTSKNVAEHPLTGTPDKRTESDGSSSSASRTQQQQPRTPQHQKDVNNSNNTVSSPPRSSYQQQHLTASDALSVRQNGPEATIAKLRNALDEATARDATSKSALAKSDAVILELRGTIRQLKRQLETLQQEKQKATLDQKTASDNKIKQLQSQVSNLQHQLAISQSSSKDAKVGELQVQLDRAHAQILTADMVRKELEDTLEAEQYTWELRVQDQDRQLELLQAECETLAKDLSECRSQWKEAEEGWNQQLDDLQNELRQARAARSSGTNNNNDEKAELVAKIQQMEKERGELQGCLDEALQELEAVDAELQTEQAGGAKSANNNATPLEVVESLQHLYRWILQEGPGERRVHNLSKEPVSLLKDIRLALQDWITSMDGQLDKVDDSEALKAQLTRYQDELKNRESSSAELRESLKEAVALLKPLQDAVAKGDEEKQELQAQMDDIERQRADEHKAIQKQLQSKAQEIDRLNDQVASLESQLKTNKSFSSPVSTATARSTPPGTDDSMSRIQRAREELRRKRETEGNLQQLLKDAQSRFNSMHQQNEDQAAKNRELQGKLKSAEHRLSHGGEEETPPEDQILQLERQLEQKNKQIESLQEALEEQGGQEKLQELDAELRETQKQLANKEQAEHMLNKSLKEALGLLKPLQMHLEEAEAEKMEISKELRNLRKRFRQLQMGELNDDTSKSTAMGGQDVSIELLKIKEELEETVRQLELENSQLHDALDDVSESIGGVGGSDAKLRQQIVELNSRYEVTQNKLEDAHVENHALVKALKQKEHDEKQREVQLRKLKQELAHSRSELNNAKAIARSALVKVEELTMANVEQLSMSLDGSVEVGFGSAVSSRS